MGDSDDSSMAAQSAPGTGDMNGHEPQPGFWQRLLGFGGNGEEDDSASASSAPRTPERPIHGMINLRRMRVEDVAVPKADIIAVPNTITKDDLVSVFRESGLTRLPVYEGTLDTPVGMAHLKDFALQHGFNGTGGRFNLKRMLRPLLFVPPSMPIGVLLTKMQTERRHMALVIDEYGGVDGLVTIEDLIEQVIGEIADEHDTDEDMFWTREKTGCYLVQAKTPLTDFEGELGLTLTDHDTIDGEEIDTLGGLVFMLAGRVPARGEVVPHPVGLDFEVVDADPRRIKRLRVRPSGTTRAEQVVTTVATPEPPAANPEAGRA
ncbi:hemolysin family protein [Mameliella sediminis]|uniref:hemolysin family protein n=1 Tax=Mameliella sediminis TaxID=2836866 RepID=UPI001C494CE4|nr:hemolysin family protein [Mameliella sediminis]MBY6113264.1 hemolysin family protein [Antarctobacter heliothermus]MBY6143388.1 hemolysin family protein [Mameliella alba]MBV7394595.1 hemolysin family protein [Mameliella sediminis]MBY6164085.1 hemolysin family protein [Mameliella alba]MBY6172589.1 hemolysin family protein [Mameliella alba]